MKITTKKPVVAHVEVVDSKVYITPPTLKPYTREVLFMEECPCDDWSKTFNSEKKK